jgi:hypothetical protein
MARVTIQKKASSDYEETYTGRQTSWRPDKVLLFKRKALLFPAVPKGWLP